MKKFHINDKGDVGECSAGPGRCHYGSDAPHYSTADEARNAYESKMEEESFLQTLTSNPLDSDTYVSILTPDGGVLTEGTGSHVTQDLDPGEYMAQYSTSSGDRYIRILVQENGATSISKADAFESIELHARKETVEAFETAAKELAKAADEIACAQENRDHATVLAISDAYRRILVKHDYTTGVGSFMARRDLADLRAELDRDEAKAHSQNMPKKVEAIRSAAAPLEALLARVSRGR